jgi:uncharacterized protein (DUF2336 family)
MKSPILASIDGLTDLGTRSGIDVRPTLLRVLTDLYVQKPTHTPDEDRHYTELALRLIEAVDVTTRAAVAERLATHRAPPAKVVTRLARDLPEVAAPLQRLRASSQEHVADEQASAIASGEALSPAIDAVLDLAVTHDGTGVAQELNELFLGANADERRLILLNLEVLTPLPPGHVPVSRDPHACQRLEAAALARDIEQFAQHLARSLHIARAQALSIARDELGEPVVVAAKVLKMQADMLQRILLFLNPSVGQSVARVHALATLYDEMTLPAAEQLLAIWQAMQPPERPAAGYRPQLWDDEARRRARETSTAQRAIPHGSDAAGRRTAS